MDCRVKPGNDAESLREPDFVIASSGSDEAIQRLAQTFPRKPLDCFATLAMTKTHAVPSARQ
jgi:histidinol-phosphate/aromatic aminotransferase/cobyric acid decarboxylase-like protein